jgi:predicted DNA-binding transcriptional regulator AlpA
MTNHTQEPKPWTLLDTTAAAEVLGVKPDTLVAWRHRGGGPKFVSVGPRAIRYRWSDLMEWMDSRVFSNTIQAKGDAA